MRIRNKQKVPRLLEQADAWIYATENGKLPIDRTRFQRVCLEVGCGKGNFISTLGERNSDTFYLGIDKFVEIIARAASKSAIKEVDNVKIARLDVQAIETLLDPQSIATIYLNFSDPWPRRRNGIRRLTHPNFLSLYAKLLQSDGFVEMKTDNADLFAFSVTSFNRSGWTIVERDDDLTAKVPEGQEHLAKYIKTEYEMRFRSQGVAIHYLKAFPPKPV
nr:tRNA (guanosine(46)-N7)-methyltransferase TrmB [Bacilli bacterium]